ncbi:pro-epidermal growth factor isoform X1 [Hemibagrus wyckioides]|uniref:pro-epidermal growth factor isoform X1 n=1 Tax=Hemibagrus wyckioides TaxID=337641 RepID=UPI00266D375C|nr:pro-epidermal growth factor isoform X1 [Hemibagrus wyckioides]
MPAVPRGRVISGARKRRSGIMSLGRLTAILHLIFWVENSHADTSTSCWTSGNRSCVDPEPYLLVGFRNAIVLTDLDGSGQKRLVSGVGNGLVDFHYREGRVYWVDTHTGVLSRVNLDGTHAQRLLSLGKGISGLAVDWRENSLYWSSRKTGTIRRADTDGRNVKTVLRDLTQPSSVVTDPNTGYVFWLSASVLSSIQRSDLTGGLIATVLKTSDRLLCLVSDVVERKLFWILHYEANELGSLGSCDYNGNGVNIINQRLSRTMTPKMSLFLDYVYVTDPASQSVMRVKRHMAEPLKEVKAIKMQNVPVDVKVIHPTIQPEVESPAAFTPVCETDGCVNVCSSSDGHCQCKPGFKLSKHGNYCEDLNECALWNHGCSLGCENVQGSYFCTCPEGYVLLPDHRTCREMKPCVENGTLCEHACTHTLEGDVCVCPVGSSLKPDGRSCTGCVSVDRGGCSQVCVTLSPGRWECMCQPGYQLQTDGKQCKASGPPALMLFANMVDVRSVNVDGSDSRSLMNESKRSIMAVDYDPVQNRVYFADTERKQIEGVSVHGGETEVLITDLVSPEGIAVDWTNRRLYWTDRGMFSVSRSRLSGQESTVLIQDKRLQPRDIAVHPQAQTIFWTDVGVPVAVWRAGLDGEDRMVLIGSGLVSPCGITVDHNTHTLYWSDIGAGRIESAGLDGSHRHTLTHKQVGRPFDVVVFEDTLWFSNWEDNHIYHLDKRTGSDVERLSVDSVQPASLVIVHPLIKPGADLCLHGNGGCSQLCESRLGLAHCSCHSQHILSVDGKTCFPTDTSSSFSSSSSAGSGNGEWSDQVKNKSLNDESSPLSQSSEREPFTEKMVSDQDECFSLRCDVNAQCVLEGGVSVCRCLRGFTGDGQLCMDIDECVTGLVACTSPQSECVNTPGGYFCQCGVGFNRDGHHCIDVDECRLELHSCDEKAVCVNSLGGYECRCRVGYTGTGFSCSVEHSSTSRPSSETPPQVTTPWQRGDMVDICPSTHDSYCLNNAVCFYFPEMETFACNCVPGYMGERCQYSDLEWWDLQQVEEEKRRNTTIAVCITVVLLLLFITATITYCYRYHRCRRCTGRRAAVDMVSETSVCEESVTESPSVSPQVYVLLEHMVCNNEKMIPIVGSQRRGVCPCCSPETGESVISEDTETQKTHLWIW